jgi:cyclophilin family peptidyl-prolyl cis-trans isomerase
MNAPRHTPLIALALTLTGGAFAQTIRPVAPPTSLSPTSTPQQAAPSTPLPPPLSVAEQRFRDLSTRVRAQKAIDETLRAELRSLCEVLEADLAAPTTARDVALRLLAARAQCAIWLEDNAAIDAAFSRLSAMNPSSEATTIAWARELNAMAQFERAAQLIQSREFNTRMTDAKIAWGEALTGLHRFDEAQAALNTAPGGRSPAQQKAISDGTYRTQTLRGMFEKELIAMDRDQTRGDLPLVQLMTSQGPIEIELFEEQAPNSVGNFIEHVEAGHYDGTTFHRILRGLGVQGGDPATAEGAAGGKSTGGWTIPDECDREDRRAPLAGRLIMAKQAPATGAREVPAPHSAGSQFVMLVTPMEELDGKYTVFGRVTDGFEIVRSLTAEDTIASARVVRKREHEYKGVRFSEATSGSFVMPRTVGEGGNRATPAATEVKLNAPGAVNLGSTPDAKPTPPSTLQPVQPAKTPSNPAAPTQTPR